MIRGDNCTRRGTGSSVIVTSMGIASVGHIASSTTIIAASQGSSSSGRTTTGTVAGATAHGAERFDRIFHMGELAVNGSAAGTAALGSCNNCGGTGYVTNAGDAHAGHNHAAAGTSAGTVVASNHNGGLLSGLHGNGSGHATYNGGAVAPAPVSTSGAYGGHGAATPQAAPSGQAAIASPCGNGGCGGNSCGDPACHGLFGRKGSGAGANGCGTPGCTAPGCGLGGMFAGHGNGGSGSGFGGCGNPGCNSCGNGAGLGHGAGGHSGMGHGDGAGHLGLGSKLAGLFHRGPKVKWFTGPGGPVPLTPGYVPYVNPIRSPRDYFAFPPYLDQAMQPGYGAMPQSTAGFATDKATTPTDFVAPSPKAVVPPPAPRGEKNRATGTVPPPAPRSAAPAPAAAGAEKEDN